MRLLRRLSQTCSIRLKTIAAKKNPKNGLFPNSGVATPTGGRDPPLRRWPPAVFVVRFRFGWTIFFKWNFFPFFFLLIVVSLATVDFHWCVVGILSTDPSFMRNSTTIVIPDESRMIDRFEEKRLKKNGNFYWSSTLLRNNLLFCFFFTGRLLMRWNFIFIGGLFRNDYYYF